MQGLSTAGCCTSHHHATEDTCGLEATTDPSFPCPVNQVIQTLAKGLLSSQQSTKQESWLKYSAEVLGQEEVVTLTEREGFVHSWCRSQALGLLAANADHQSYSKPCLP